MKTSEPSWVIDARENHIRWLREISVRKGRSMALDEIVNYLALAITGEAGELANLIKKRWRGDIIEKIRIANEIADVRIYLQHIADQLNIDIDDACKHKTEIVSRRLESFRQSAETNVEKS